MTHSEANFDELERLRYFHKAFGGTATPRDPTDMERHVSEIWKAIQNNRPLPKPPRWSEYLRKQFPYSETDGREARNA